MIPRCGESRIRDGADRRRENYGSAPYPARLFRSKPYLRDRAVDFPRRLAFHGFVHRVSR